MINKLLESKNSIVKFLSLCFLSGLFLGCEKEEQYASATINGIHYAETKVHHPLNPGGPPTIRLFEDIDVAFYRTGLKPLSKGYPIFAFDFLILLEEGHELELNNSYKIQGVLRQSEEYNYRYEIENIEYNFPIGYDGVVFCFKEGLEEALPVEGMIRFDRYVIEGDDHIKETFYYGSYQLSATSEMNEPLIIKCEFKCAEVRGRFNYN